MFLQSFARTRRKADIIATRNILGHDDVDVIHGVGSVWPDVAFTGKFFGFDELGLETRGVEPISRNVCPRMSADVLIQGIPRQSATRGLPWTIADVITNVIRYG